MNYKNALLAFALIMFLFSCGKKDEKQEYIDDPVKNSDINSKENKDSLKKEVSIADSLLRKKKEIEDRLAKENNPDQSSGKDNKSFEKTYSPVAVVSPLEAGDYLGKDLTVKGFVADVYKNEKVAYLNFVQKFPNNPFTAVVFASRFSTFGNIDKYEKKTVEVTGRVSNFKGKPQIILDSESQIKIVK